ncbi:sodium:solute symporter family protein, partial [bacterium]|nr:sodium:solute symporter family protein [bacterium]
PEWLGGLIVCLVVLLYVTYGGLRGTAWANTFQTLVFMILGGVAYYVIVSKMGGLGNAMSAVADTHPELLIRGDLIKPLKLLTYLCIPLSAGMFPHLFMHWLSAKSAASFKVPVIFYPICMIVVWIPSVTLGVLGRVDFPGLQGPAANSVLVQMIGLYAPDVLAGLLAAGVFAAVMSSLDSQVLAIGTMFTQDIALHYGFHDRMSEKQQVLFGRIFVCAILLITYIIFLISNSSIFKLGVWSFTGFAALLPIAVAALFWKRSTKHGAIAAIFSVMVSWVYFLMKGWEIPNYTVGGTGIMPVAFIIGVSTATMIIVSMITQPPDRARVERFFPSTVPDPSARAVPQRKIISD